MNSQMVHSQHPPQQKNMSHSSRLTSKQTFYANPVRHRQQKTYGLQILHVGTNLLTALVYLHITAFKLDGIKISPSMYLSLNEIETVSIFFENSSIGDRLSFTSIYRVQFPRFSTFQPLGKWFFLLLRYGSIFFIRFRNPLRYLRRKNFDRIVIHSEWEE